MMKVLDLNIKILQVFGLWPNARFNKAVNYFVGFSIVSQISIMAAPVIAALIYQITHSLEEPAVVIETFIVVVDYLGFLYMYFCFSCRFSLIKRIIDDFNEFLKFCPKNVIEKAEDKVKFYIKCTLSYFLVGLIINGIVPLFDKSNCNKRRLSNFYRQYDPCGLSVRNLFPFDVSGPIWFPIVYILQFIACCGIALGVLVITLFIVGIVIHIIAQLRYCRYLIVKTLEENVNNPYIGQKVNFCIEYHNSIIEYAWRVNRAFSMIMLLYITITSLVLSLLGFQILLATNTNDKIRYIMHLFGWIGLLFLTCYYGQSLIDESSLVADAAFNSLWYNCPVSVQWKVKMIIMRAQKPLILSATSLGIMSFTSFLNVMKSAYSYFTLLLTITHK